MADAVTSQTLFDGERLFIGKFTNISDGTGEVGALKIDVSTLAANAAGLACNGVKINKISVMTDGMGVNIYFDATTDQLALTVPQNVDYTTKFDEFGGIVPNNTAAAGYIGDILFSTVGATSGDRYTITMECIKTYTSVGSIS